MPIEVALDAYVLPNDHRVFKFFPGKNYKFFDVIRGTSVAIIDVRDLDALGNDPAEWDDDDILTHIAEDRVERAVANGEPRPSRLVKSVGDKQIQTFLEGLFFTAQKGDLILMPQKGYTTDVLIGQLLDAPGRLVTIEAEDDDELHTYYGRRVRWVGTVEKRLFNTQLIDLLQTQVAFFNVGRSHYEEVYRLAFDNFVYDAQFVATFHTAKNIFTPKDNFLTSVWLELLEVLEEARQDQSDLPTGSIYELVVDSDIAEDSRDDLSIRIESPGWFRVRSVVAAPFASLALFAMAADGVPYDQAINATVTAKIVRGTDDACMGDVDASVRDYIRLLGQNRWEEACRLAARAQAEARLSADARVRARREED